MNRRSGLTLAEVLILIVIIGVLVALLLALLLPATQSARESARHAAEAPQLSMNDANSTESRMKSAEKSLSKGSLVPQDARDGQAVANMPRKIVYEAEITLVVKDVSQTESTITELVKQFDGYVADSAVDRRQGEQLWGRWQVRIPVDKFDAFLDAVSKLGIAESRHQTAQDVTEEFVDLEARIANKKRLEARIVELLDSSSGQIKDVIEVERELARVRGEIEQMEGRLKFLTNRTDLTTVSISAREQHDYVPPAAPSFSARIKEAWGGSFVSLREYGQDVTVAAVYVLPWAVILGVVLGPPLWLLGRRRGRNRTSSHTEQP